MLSISKHADLHLRARNVRELDRSTETLVLLRVIVLQTNLKLNRLSKVTLLLLRFSLDGSDGFSKSLALKLTIQQTQSPFKNSKLEQQLNFLDPFETLLH